MRSHRDGREVVDGESNVVREHSISISRREPDALRDAAEVRAENDRGDPDTRTASVIFYAREPIDDDFGVTGSCVGRCRETEREPQRCNHRMKCLHDYLPLCGRREAPASRKDTPKLPL